jgi:transposase-like protein
LADLVARGMDATGGLLVVIDGAKALASAVRRVFGDHALVQRCTIHKRRNVTDHLPRHRRAFVDRRLAKAFNEPDPARGLRAARALARQLEAEHPDAAASLREGLEDMFTVRRLGVSDRLARTLSTSKLGRRQDALPILIGRFSCPRPPNRTCTFPRIRLST